MSELVNRIEAIIPIYPSEAPDNARTPYAVYEVSESPIRTKEGIAGYEGTLTVIVFASSMSIANAISRKVIEAIDSTVLDGTKFYYSSCNGNGYSDIGVSSNELTFNTLR